MNTPSPSKHVLPDLVLSGPSLESLKAGIRAEANNVTTFRQEARDAVAEVASNQAEIERLTREIDAARKLKDQRLQAADESYLKVREFTGIVNLAHASVGLPHWALCRHCLTPITLRGSTWGHDCEGFPAECRPGQHGSTFAEPIPEQPTPAPETNGTPRNGVEALMTVGIPHAQETPAAPTGSNATDPRGLPIRADIAEPAS